MYEIVERYNFTATHQVRGLPGCHSHAAVHLHRWIVEIGLKAAALPPVNGLSELAELEPVRHYIGWELDGKCLNEVLPQPPTPAGVAGHLTDWCVANLTGYARAVLHSITISIDARSSARRVVPAYEPNRDGPVRLNPGSRT
jgi:6-pyruvoyltetrahydropterin/6-carboxytetrahydropterin synthase